MVLYLSVSDESDYQAFVQTTLIRKIEQKKGKKRETQTAKAVAADIPDDEEDADYQKEIRANRQEYREAYAGFQSLQGLISDLDGTLTLSTLQPPD
jgi:hypothetical protein